MNTLSAVITTFTTDGIVSLVSAITSDGLEFHALLLENGYNSPYAHSKKQIEILFKESEVFIALPPLSISARNTLSVTIEAIEEGEILTLVTLKATHSIFRSLITSASAKQLGLHKGQTVIAVIKANEISLKEPKNG